MNTLPQNNGFSIVIPFHNNASTIERTLDSLNSQTTDQDVELILVEDNSSDSTELLAMNHPISIRWTVTVIKKQKKGSLSAAYNIGYLNARYDKIIYMHADCYLMDNNALDTVARHFQDNSVIAVKSLCSFQLSDWNRMNFWDKVSNARYIGHEAHGFGGKFDAVRRSILEQIGSFDEEHFLSAGEDVDIIIRLQKAGTVVPSDIRVVHAHEHPLNTPVRSIIRKQCQLGEAWGALIRKHWHRIIFDQNTKGLFMIHSIKGFLILGLLYPAATPWSLTGLFIIAFLQAGRIFTVRDRRIVLVPFLNVFLIAVFTFSSLAGFMKGRQSFHYV